MINETLQKGEEKVWQKTEAWRKAGGFKHKKPCQEWLNGNILFPNNWINDYKNA